MKQDAGKVAGLVAIGLALGIGLAIAVVLNGCASVKSVTTSPLLGPIVQIAAGKACASLSAADRIAAEPFLDGIVMAVDAGNPARAVEIAQDNAIFGAIGMVWYAVHTVLDAEVPEARQWIAALPSALRAAAVGCGAAQ